MTLQPGHAGQLLRIVWITENGVQLIN